MNSFTIRKVHSAPVINQIEFESGEVVDVQRYIRSSTYGSRKDLNFDQSKILTKLSAQVFLQGPSTSIDYDAIVKYFNKSESIAERRHSF